MSDDMGTFRIDIELENPAQPGEKRRLANVLVDTGAELTWVPAHILESLGIERYSRWHLLGARSLEGLNLRVEPATKRLVDAGPAPAAAIA